MRVEPLGVIQVSRELLDAQVLGLDFAWLSADGGDAGILVFSKQVCNLTLLLLNEEQLGLICDLLPIPYVCMEG